MKVDDADAHSYTYDNLYQLINMDYNGGSITSYYYYDSLGNRTSVVDGDGVVGYWKMDDNAATNQVQVEDFHRCILCEYNKQQGQKRNHKAANYLPRLLFPKTKEIATLSAVK